MMIKDPNDYFRIKGKAALNQKIVGAIAAHNAGIKQMFDDAQNEKAAPSSEESAAPKTKTSNESVAGKNATDKPKINDGLMMLKASDIKARPIDWLWFGYLAKGKFHLLAGMPSTGKTTLAMAIAATVSNGSLWPDGTPCTQGNVIVWSGEDGLDDTLVPRLIAHGANLDKIYFVSDVVAKGEKRPFDPASDMAMLCQTVKAIGNVSLIIVDPIVSAITGDSHKNAEVRRGLQPLVDLGDELNAAIVGISHFSKGTKGNDPMERVTGSIAYTALARIVLVTAKKVDENNTTTRIFTRAKSNISLDGGGFNYDIENTEISTDTGTAQTTKAVFGNWLDGSALHLLADTESEQEGGTEVTDAAKFLLDLFKDATLTQDGTIEKKEVIRLATANGFKERTIQRAREKLGIEFSPSGFGSNKKSVWRLPKNVNSANYGESTHTNDLTDNPSIVPCVPIVPIVPNKKRRGNNGMNGNTIDENEKTSFVPPIVTPENIGTHGTIGTNGANHSNAGKIDVSVISANSQFLDDGSEVFDLGGLE